MSHPGAAPGLSYGLAGFPLAFAALPLYVQLPAHYAGALGMPLATVGTVLLAVRAIDAVADPLLGRWIDARLIGRGAALRVALPLAALALAAGFLWLFFPPAAARGAQALVAWCAACLVLASLSHSTITVIHQAWGTQIAHGPQSQARLAAWREGCALGGVVVASVLPSLAGFGPTAALLAVALAIAVAALLSCPSPPAPAARARDAAGGPAPSTRDALLAPWRDDAFPRLLAVFMVNGTASAIPATLVLFFVRDRLQAPAHEGGFLAVYFVAAACSLPAWLRVMRRIGLARAWRAGMLLSVAGFVGALALGPGDVAGFYVICAATGAALGADLVAPGALLAAWVQRRADAAAAAGAPAPAAGASFGWWNLAAKLNLALAAGLGLPLLALLGYAPGQRDGGALQALQGGYAGLPCLLKLAAVALLATLWIPHEESTS